MSPVNGRKTLLQRGSSMDSLDNTSSKAHLRYDTERTSSLSIKPVVEDQLRECPQAILWCNGGLFGLIPMERVKNAVVLRNEKRGAGIEPTPLVFNWNEAVVLNPSQLALLDLSASAMRVHRLR